MEEALLKSSSLFPYFMLVAFEAGGLFRALVLFLSYPFVCLFSKEIGIKIMVLICFCGIKRANYRLGRSVLPKFLLEDVGYEGFQVVMRYKKKVAVSDIPNVMVEGFLRDCLDVNAVIGRDLKVFFGYFVGLMEVKRDINIVMNEIIGQENMNRLLVGFGSASQQFFSHCKEIYLVTSAEKTSWRILPRENYPKPLIFHDGRLAFRPTYSATLSMFVWLPFGFPLSIIRMFVAVFLPYKVAIPILAFTGMVGSLSRRHSIDPTIWEAKTRGLVYVSNHRTLLDPIYISLALMKPVITVTYSISRISELLSPLKCIRLTRRDREEDLKMMEEILSLGNIVVCPEGTTCREPYLLRFSPLFAELSDDIVPVALDSKVSMFYGTTASGHKILDPLFFLLNPRTIYIVNFLEKLQKSHSCTSGELSKIEVANYVQNKIAKALGFQCTNITRKEKYMLLAGNEGTI
ncbi:putative glycerol-3-phosphate acyltransferase 3 [Abeliophyllum distichum]|uniref:Glycerol-3-phosphate acyltransferase 3 n=1 Tax=Abeliophyllum distichum TaxID=126358 RepID=A0ABD1RS26_9LAMI